MAIKELILTWRKYILLSILIKHVVLQQLNLYNYFYSKKEYSSLFLVMWYQVHISVAFS